MATPSASPQTTREWTVTGSDGVGSLKLSEEAILDLSDNEVLVNIKAASLNFRDVMIARGDYPFPLKPNIVLGSDGAGTVLAIGKRVTRFKPGDKVATIINPLYHSGHLTNKIMHAGLGGTVDGTLRTIGAFDEQGLVTMPESLSFIEASTLSCAGLVAWNALFGLQGRKLEPGDWLLTQGTGGVSIFALQFAKAVGARVIATTSSSSGEKVELLKKLGADHIVNYKEAPDWGATAKELTGGVGVDLVVEVGGSAMDQSAACLKPDGIISVVGAAGGIGSKNMPGLQDCWLQLYTTRGVHIGSRAHMEEMCRAIEANPEKLRPVVDPNVFKFDQLKEALEYLSSGKHMGKVCVDMAGA